MFQVTSFDVWKKEKELCKIVTLCRNLDLPLDGGIPMRMVTELCGAPGTGKTEMCLLLSINVQIPRYAGGVEGCALYVDTNQDFNPERLKELATYMEERFQKEPLQSKYATSFTTSSILQNVSYMYCADYVELMATVEYMKELVKKLQLKLIIIDSYSFPLRCIDDNSRRYSVNNQLLTELQQLAFRNNIAIVITNELTTRMQDGNSKICPALGESHAHKINQRILFTKSNETMQRIAYLEKSLLSPQVGAPFVIEKRGIRDKT